MAKNIILCCDGTNNEATSDSTNVLRLYRMLVRDESQLTYYDGGVGTLADPAAISAFRKVLSRRLDAAIGMGIRDNFCHAYRFLARNYQPGDKIFLFGFSRGAYTVRALAGAIHLFGLPRPELDGLAALAWAAFANDDGTFTTSRRFGGGRRFKKAFSVDPPVSVHFVGVWDTVASFGWIWNFRTLPHTADNPSIVHARHALAIDERRACFQANHFRPDAATSNKQIKQVWFPGVHSDVGGGYPENESALSKISLEWMLREARAQGLLLDDVRIDDLIRGKGRSAPDPAGEAHESLNGLWHVLECLPRRGWNHDKKRMAWVWPNRGRCRPIVGFHNKPRLHRSVLARIERHVGYSPTNLPAEYDIED